MTKIYRIISFETFIDMLMKQSLTFVHPTLWDDPYESKLVENNFKKMIESSRSLTDIDTLGALLEHIISMKLYCQSWTKLDESDALWRIYSHNNTSVRIEIDMNNISKIENVEVLEVKYVDDIYEAAKESTFYDMVSTKRKAFSHESELRLVTHFKFNGTKEAEEYISDYLKFSGDSRFFNNIKIEEVPVEINRLVSKFNYNLQDKTVQIYYGHVENFIESVLLNPFAPDWFNDTLRMVCEKYNIKYLGKSQLYTINV